MDKTTLRKQPSHLMRVLCLFFLLNLCGGSIIASQNVKLSLNMSNTTFSDVFREIEKKTGYKFVYNTTEINQHDVVSVNETNKNLSDILAGLFKNKQISFRISNKHIALFKTQKKRVSGTVLDPFGEPVIGANVVEKGTMNGIITDINGKFALDVVSGATLVISYIGYTTIEVPVANKENLTITLKEDTETLEEVVVVGYGTQKKVNLTGAVETVNTKSLEGRSLPNLSQALQGSVSGANFSVGNSGFEPGADMTFQIRGQGDAYVLVDGVETDLSKLNPNDIESISILKDAAAAAVYGAKASYGVVLVTTKSGKKESKPVVNFNANVSYAINTRMPSKVDSYTWAKVLNEAGANGGGIVFTDEVIDRIIAYQNDPTLPETVADGAGWATTNKSNANNDWYDIYFGGTVNNQESVSVKGGGKKASYYVSAGHVYNGSTLQFGEDNFRRYNTVAKIDVKLADWWDFSVNNRFMNSNRIRPNLDSQGDYPLLFHFAANKMPTVPQFNPSGYRNYTSMIPLLEDGGNDKTVTNEFVQRFATEIRLLKGFKVNADYTVKYNTLAFTSDNFTCYSDMVDGSFVAQGTTVPSYVNKYQQQQMYTSFNVYGSYEFDINKNNFAIMAGAQRENQRTERITGRKDGIVSNDVPSFSTSTGNIYSLTDALSHLCRMGYFARINYNYANRYLLEINGRYDGTSVFAHGNRWGFFPSISAGWNISNEKFFDNILSSINNLKLRLSWGSLGNQNVDAYQDLALMGLKTNLSWLINGERPSYATQPNLVNTELTWEKSNTFDVGLDMSFLNGRLAVSGDWYQRNTYNRLGPAEALPAVLGQTIPQMNNAELRTNGWELSVSWKDQVTKDFSYSVSAMLYDYYSEVTKYNNPTNILTTYYKGSRIGDIWGYTSNGLIQSDEEATEITNSGYQKQFYATWNKGDVKYEDLNEDGVINNGNNTLDDHGDLSIIGNSSPRYQFALNLGAKYKNLDFSMMMQGVGKRDVWFGTNNGAYWGIMKWNQSSLNKGRQLDYYRDQEATTYVGLGLNTDAYFARPYINDSMNNKNRQTSTRYLQNGAYLRFKNIQIGYNLPEKFISKINLSKVRFYFSGENLGVITGNFPDYMDPETATQGYNNQGGKSMNPQASYSFGIDVEF